MSGGFASSFYTAMWRNTKDMDLCVVPDDRESMIEATREAGMHDLYDEKPYRPPLDLPFDSRRNHRRHHLEARRHPGRCRRRVDRARATGQLYPEKLRLVPPEEMIWSKIHIVQRERCDWTDIMNMLYATGAVLDWKRLTNRLASEQRLLAAVLLLFSWVAPGRARTFPGVESGTISVLRVRKKDPIAMTTGSRAWIAGRGSVRCLEPNRRVRPLYFIDRKPASPPARMKRAHRAACMLLGGYR